MGKTAPKTELLICIKCRGADPAQPDDTRPGAELFARLTGQDTPEGIAVKPVECLSNCTRGCSVVLRGAGKWSYVYGNLRPDDTEILLEGAVKYQAAEDGLVPWRERPEHFRKNCIARMPPLET